ncbi:hypothetical protein M8C21_011225, partial [Ambrosia artemisiifolia]
ELGFLSFRCVISVEKLFVVNCLICELRMRQGEACVVVVTNVAEMENERNERNQQKRDRHWLTDGSDMEPLVKKQVKECSVEDEEESCVSRVHTEGLNDDKPQPCVEQNVKESLDGMTREPCSTRQTAEGEELVQQCLKVTDQQICEMKQGTECLDYIGTNPTERLVKDGSYDMEIEPVVEQPVKECLNEIKLETGVESDGHKDPMQTVEDRTNIEVDNSIEQPDKKYSNAMETYACGKIQSREALIESKPEPYVHQPVKECLDDMESEVDEKNHTTQSIKQTTHALDDIAQSVKECKNEIVIDTCNKEVKEASNDDISSEVSNPNISPRDNSSSFQTVNSQPNGKLVMKDQVVCGEITSACSGNLSSEGNSSQEEHGTNDTYGTVSTSHVVIEVPKHATTSSGIRKITFKFSKRKEDYDNQLSASVSGTRKVPRLTPISEQGLHEHGDSVLYSTNMESMTVKKLLSTRILEGAKVKYVSASGELVGIVKDCGYLCGCATCNFSNAMKSAPFSRVDEAIKMVAGSSVNEENFQVWKGDTGISIVFLGDTEGGPFKHIYTHGTHAREDGSSAYYFYRKSSAVDTQPIVNETLKERKCLFKKPKSYTYSTAFETKRSAESGHKKRDNDLHRLLFMPSGLPDGTELAYYARGKKILDGYKHGNGIVCSHCDTEISPSQFEAHAGWAAKRQPAHDFSVAEFDDRTVLLCDQCEKEYHVGCLRESGRCDLKALPSDNWFCCNHCDMIHGAIQDVVVNGASVVSGSVLSTINKKHMEKGVFSGAPNEIRWQMLSGKSRYPEHLLLLSRAAAIFRECFDPIVAKSGRDLIPVMVYGRNISGQEFGGIYCVVLMAGPIVVSAGLLRIFGREVAELPLVATSRQHQGKGYFQALFFSIEELLLSLGVELLVLPAAEEAESIWTKKLGFRKMSDERLKLFINQIV